MVMSDLLIILVYMLRVIGILLRGYEWFFEGIVGLVFCKLVYFIYEIVVSVIIFFVICISGECFLVVVCLLKILVNGIKVVCYLIVFIWMIFLFFRILILIVNKIGEYCGKVYCSFFLDEVFWLGFLVLYYKFNLIGMYVMFMGVMIVLYLVMIFFLI